MDDVHRKIKMKARTVIKLAKIYMMVCDKLSRKLLVHTHFTLKVT